MDGGDDAAPGGPVVRRRGDGHGGERMSAKSSPVTSLAVVSLGGWMGLIAACSAEL